MLFRSMLADRPFLLFDVGGAAAAAGLLFLFAFSATRNARTLYRAEPLRSCPDGPPV